MNPLGQTVIGTKKAARRAAFFKMLPNIISDCEEQMLFPASKLHRDYSNGPDSNHQEIHLNFYAERWFACPSISWSQHARHQRQTRLHRCESLQGSRSCGRCFHARHISQRKLHRWCCWDARPKRQINWMDQEWTSLTPSCKSDMKKRATIDLLLH